MEKKRRSISRCAAGALSVILTVTTAAGSMPFDVQASTSRDNGDGTFTNPVIYSDVPDPDVIRVGDTYYMVSTTMHMSPGCPIMKSKDLVNWEIVNYCYGILEDTDEFALRNGKNAYGQGSWAASLKYHDGKYYVAVASLTTWRTYLFTTTDIEHGSWKKSVLEGYNHDLSLFFDDDGKIYLFSGQGNLNVRELEEDAEGNITYKEGGLDRNIIADASIDLADGLHAEGCHVYKVDGMYYAMMIQWPSDRRREEICWRSDSITGEWEGRIVLNSGLEYDGVEDGAGVAQGGLVQAEDGNWYSLLFQDHGAVGRIPVLTSVTWEEQWPVFAKPKAVMELPVTGQEKKSIVISDEFYNGAERAGYLEEGFDTPVGKQSELQALSQDAVTAYAMENGLSAAARDLVTNGGFDDGTDSWETFGASQIAVETRDDNQVLKVTKRQQDWNGASQKLNHKVVIGGKYSGSGRVLYEDNDKPTCNFTIMLKARKTSGDGDHYLVLGSVEAKSGEWAEFVPNTVTIPEDLDVSDAFIYISGDGTADFSIDDIGVAVESVPGILINGDFESGTAEGWYAHDGATLEVVTEEAASGSYSLKVTNRTNTRSTAAGPEQDITGKVKAGKTYDIFMKIKYTGDSTPEARDFNMTLSDGDWTSYTIMMTGTAKRGEWTTITGSFTMPEEFKTEKQTLFLENTWVPSPDDNLDLMDFYVDDVTVVERKHVISTEDGEHDYNGSNLNLAWQWNHNPNNNNWSLTERSGYLRLTTGALASGIQDAKNTLTQRTYGPVSSGSVAVEVGNMKNGDVTGLSVFQKIFGFAGVKMENGRRYLVMQRAADENDEIGQEIARVELNQDRVYLKADCDFRQWPNQATFYYSLDGINWTQIGDELQMAYTQPHFMGYRYALFNYATKAAGGYVDFDYFRVSDEIAGAVSGDEKLLNATIESVSDIPGVQNTVFDVPLKLASLPDGTYRGMEVSISIPKELGVEDVEFNEEALTGNATWSFANQQLKLSLSGETVDYKAGEDRLFATLKLKVNRYLNKDTSVTVRTDYIKVTGGEAVYNTNTASASIGLLKMDSNAVAKLIGNSNPLVDYKYGADPYAMEYNGRVYIYMTSDEYEYDENGNLIDNTYGKISTISVISSADMVNWTDHGAIPVAGKNNPDGAAKWATCSWAPAAAHKTIDGKEKFFLYFADGAGGIGVLEADSPIGPFTDPNGKALIAPGSKEAEGVVWLFDPAVLVDDDGNGYLYYGGGIPNDKDNASCNHPQTARVIKLADNMTSVEGDAGMIDAPCMFEDSGIHKYGDKYYYSYCSNFSGQHEEGNPGYGIICYMVSDSPMGPFTYVGEILENPYDYFEVGGNNHHAIFEFGGQYYITYHAQTLGKANGIEKGYRSTHINAIEFYGNGNIKPITADYEGIVQLKEVDPYRITEAETIAWQNGISVDGCTEKSVTGLTLNRALTDIQKGDWTAVAGVDFGADGAEVFKVKAASSVGGTIELRLDSPEGKKVGTVDVNNTAGTYQEYTCKLEETVTGIHNLFLVFDGGSDMEDTLMNLDYWQFVPASVKVQKDDLKAVVDQASAIKISLYTQESIADMQKALAEANAVLKNEDATQKMVDDAAKVLSDALNRLEYLPLVFQDVNEDAWYAGCVDYVSSRRIMTGLTADTFGPADALSRAQFAVILYRMAGCPKTTYSEAFQDVKDGEYYSEAVVWASENGIVTGYADTGLFMPAKEISREEFAVMMYRYAKFKEMDVSAKGDLKKFPDAASVSEFAEYAVAWAVGDGIIIGDNGKLNVQEKVNRAQCATMIQRFGSLMNEVKKADA